MTNENIYVFMYDVVVLFYHQNLKKKNSIDRKILMTFFIQKIYHSIGDNVVI
jgi:hypothetical protein